MTPLRVNVGDQVFDREDGEAFGAVREVRPEALVVDIEGRGDVMIPAPAIMGAHDGKVLLDVGQLPPDLRDAIARAHTQEDRYR